MLQAQPKKTIIIIFLTCRRSRRGPKEKNLTRTHEVARLIPGLAQWVEDLALLWLQCRLAAIALNRPLAWEPPSAAGAALKRKKNKCSSLDSFLIPIGSRESLYL